MDRRDFLALGGLAAVAGSARQRRRACPHAAVAAGQTAHAPHSVDAAKRCRPSDSAPRVPSKWARMRARGRRCARCCRRSSPRAPRSSTPRPCIRPPRRCSATCSRPNSRPRCSSPRRCGRRAPASAAEQKGVEQMQRSMALLKHKRVELMQVHNLVDLDAHLKTLRRWKAEGTHQVHRRHALHHQLVSRSHRRSSNARSSTSCSSTTP